MSREWTGSEEEAVQQFYRGPTPVNSPQGMLMCNLSNTNGRQTDTGNKGKTIRENCR